MYLQHSVYIHWNIWLNELFYMINLHWGSLLPTKALNLLQVAKPPAKWCHSEEQRARQNKLHAALVIWECSYNLHKARGDDSVWLHLKVPWAGMERRWAMFFFFFSSHWLQGKQVVFSRQTLISRHIPICFYYLALEISGPLPICCWLCGLIILSCVNEQDVLIYIVDTLSMRSSFVYVFLYLIGNMMLSTELYQSKGFADIGCRLWERQGTTFVGLKQQSVVLRIQGQILYK